MPAAPAPMLRRDEVRTLTLAALGGALEFYDFIIFVFFTATIGQLFFPPDTPDWLRQLQTFGLFAAGYLARPLGGILMPTAAAERFVPETTDAIFADGFDGVAR